MLSDVNRNLLLYLLTAFIIIIITAAAAGVTVSVIKSVKQRRYDKIKSIGNTAQRLCQRYASRFFVRLYKIDAKYFVYFKEILGNMTENMQVDLVQSLCGIAYNCNAVVYNYCRIIMVF